MPSEKTYDQCFEVYVWHDGEFPFDDSGDRGENGPAHLHHCMPSQFVEFGNLVLKLQGKPDGEAKDGADEEET